MPTKEHITVATSATRTGTTVHDLAGETTHHRGAVLYVNVSGTSGDGTQDLALTVQADNPTTDAVQALLSDTYSDGATGQRKYVIYPGVSDSQGEFDAVEEVPLPRHVKVKTDVQQGGSSPDFTYEIGMDLLP